MIAHRKKTNEVNKESFGIKINNLNLKNKKENDTVAVAKNEISPYKKENEVKVTDFIADQKYLSNISVLNQNIEEFKNMEENLMATHGSEMLQSFGNEDNVSTVVSKGKPII